MIDYKEVDSALLSAFQFKTQLVPERTGNSRPFWDRRRHAGRRRAMEVRRTFEHQAANRIPIADTKIRNWTAARSASAEESVI